MNSTLQAIRIVRLIGLVASLNIYFNFADIIAGSSREMEHQIYTEYETLKKKPEDKIANILGYLVVTKKNCPTLYKLIEESAAALKMRVPPTILIFKGNVISKIGEETGIIDMKVNAFATGFTHNSSSICIGEDLIKDLVEKNGYTVPMLQSVVLHELGHVKHYHVPKLIIPKIILIFMIGLVANTLMNQEDQILWISYTEQQKSLRIRLQTQTLLKITLLPLMFLITSLLSRICEKEADAAAAKVLDDPTVLADALDRLITIAVTKPRAITWLKNWIESHPRFCDRRAAMEKAKAEKGKN
jgi:Zn-dependent protease with chaperone function